MKLKETMRKCLCLLLCLSFLLATAVPTSASGWMDMLGGLVEVAGDMAKEYLPDIAKEFGLDEDGYALIEEAFTALLQSDWFQDSTIQEKIRFVADLLDTLGIADADLIMDGVEKVMSIKLDGHTFGVLLEDYTKALFDSYFKFDADLSEDIDQNSHVNANALIMYGLGFAKIENGLTSAKNTWEEYGLKTDMDTSCTVEDFKHNLAGYDLIVIEEHGNYDYQGVPMIVTKERYTAANAEAYADDIESGRIVSVFTSEGLVYWLHPSFFSYYYGDNQLADAIVWLGSCEGAKTSALQDAFLDSGAATVIGHSETVYTYYDFYLMNTTVSRLISGDKMNSALYYAQDRWGKSDRDFALQHDFAEIKEETAYPRMAGDSTVKLR